MGENQAVLGLIGALLEEKLSVFFSLISNMLMPQDLKIIPQQSLQNIYKEYHARGSNSSPHVIA